MRENLEIFDFELTDDEVARITGLNRDYRTGPDPDTFNRVPRSLTAQRTIRSSQLLPAGSSPTAISPSSLGTEPGWTVAGYSCMVVPLSGQEVHDAGRRVGPEAEQFAAALRGQRCLRTGRQRSRGRPAGSRILAGAFVAELRRGCQPARR